MRPRAMSGTQSSDAEHLSQIITTKTKHTRATSELLGSVTSMSDVHFSEVHVLPPGRYEQQHKQYVSSMQSPKSPSTINDASATSTLLHNNDCNMVSRELQETMKASKPAHASQKVVSKPTPTTLANSFLNIDEDLAESAAKSDLKLNDKDELSAKEAGFSFDNLVERLLSQPMSKSDGKFGAIFLCLYRNFAAPLELLSAVIQRFQAMNEGTQPQISRTTSQLRYLSILAQWVTDYPGDFAHSQTRRIVSNFVANLAGNRSFAMAAKDIGSQLEIVSEDDDTEWACSDRNRSRANTVDSFPSISSVQSTVSTLNTDLSIEDISEGSTTEGKLTKHVSPHSATSSLSSSTGQSENDSAGCFQTLLNSVENAQRQAQLLTPIPRNALTKVHWHQLMDIADGDIARELTRIDWIMFSSIRPRDLIRHVSLPGHEKDKCKNLENVNRMIDQFNHVAFWVANLVILRDKPKHRARMLEKFMGVAWVSRAWEALPFLTNGAH